MKTKMILLATWLMIISCIKIAEGSYTRQTFQGQSGRHVYILEDIHGNYQTQLSHLQTISNLLSSEDLRLLATEGATGYLSSLPLHNQPLASSAGPAAANALLLQKNQINAAFFLNSQADQQMTVVGVENKKEYAAHQAIAVAIALREKKVKAEMAKLESLAIASGNQKILREIASLKKIFDLKVSRAATQDWQEISPSSQLDSALETLQAKDKINAEVLKTQIKAIENYYQMAAQRDLSLADNLIERMDLEEVQTAALIVGGFHTEGITQILRKKGISYTVISPE